VPVYLLSAILIVVALMILAVPFAVAMSLSGIPLDAAPIPMTPTAVIFLILFLAVVFFVAVRMLMTAPVASAEHAGPIAIIRRSWTLTAGHWWHLLGFLLVFFIGAIVTLLAIGAVAGVVAQLLLGSVEAMSPAALLVALVGAVANAAITALFAVMLARIYAQLTAGGEAHVSVPSSGT
jgi:membrane-anchored glycerophosphoryl diester phosphodiesterase (GDPDase)